MAGKPKQYTKKVFKALYEKYEAMKDSKKKYDLLFDLACRERDAIVTLQEYRDVQAKVKKYFDLRVLAIRKNHEKKKEKV